MQTVWSSSSGSKCPIRCRTGQTDWSKSCCTPAQTQCAFPSSLRRCHTRLPFRSSQTQHSCAAGGYNSHTDCVQAAGCHPIDVEKIGCDFLSISSHKIHGPKGVGALFAKEKSMLAPIIFGGAEQEFGLRGGTENVAGIVGFGMACEISTKSLHEDCIWVSTLKQRFYMALTDALKKNGCAEIVHTNGSSVLSPGKTLNLCLRGIDGQTLLLMLDGKSICISAGSACRSHEAEPSHVLIAMGLTPDEARSSIRISFSRMNTADEIVDAANIIASCIEILASGVEK